MFIQEDKNTYLNPFPSASAEGWKRSKSGAFYFALRATATSACV